MHLLHWLLRPPPTPTLDIPLPARLLPHAKLAIAQALELFYYRGVLDGVIIGVLVALLFMHRKGK